ncbi:hypothetical protein [Variovorax sp. YR752]|uniref:hypothetical protein n=1 Tax=Variovorax sp. YR752 TaxID=1884383 RepID=UPI003137F2A7
MSANDRFHETPFDRWTYRVFYGAFVLFMCGMGAGVVYGFWNWLLTAPCVR